MHFAPIDETQVWEQAQRMVLAPPNGDPTGPVRPLEVVVDGVLLDGEACPRFNMRVKLDDGDLAQLAEHGELWFSLLGAQCPPVSVGLLPGGLERKVPSQ